MKPKPISVLAPPFVPAGAQVIINARRALVARRADYGHIATLADRTPKARRRGRKLGLINVWDRGVILRGQHLAAARETYQARHRIMNADRAEGNKIPFVLPDAKNHDNVPQ